MKANQKTKRPPKQEAKGSPETLEERVHRHLSDINSKITDEDIKSVKTELEIRRNSTDEQKAGKSAGKKQKRNAGRKKKNGDQNESENHTTPWDLLSEGYE
jgi:hypothetical protein